jgi:hypothetical protein
MHKKKFKLQLPKNGLQLRFSKKGLEVCEPPDYRKEFGLDREEEITAACVETMKKEIAREIERARK